MRAMRAEIAEKYEKTMGQQTIKMDNVQVFNLYLETPDTLKKYMPWGQKEFGNDQGISFTVAGMLDGKENDLIWMRLKGLYYLSRIKNIRHHENSEENESANEVCTVDVYDFIYIGTFHEIPRIIQEPFRCSTPSIKNNLAVITTAIYNAKRGTKIYETRALPREDLLTQMLTELDLEDVICLYLQLEKQYLVYFATCEKDDGCFMVKSDGSHKCFFKFIDSCHSDELTDEEYSEYIKKGYTCGYIYSENPQYVYENGKGNITYLDKETILNFMESHENILPERIREWLQFTKA